MNTPTPPSLWLQQLVGTWRYTFRTADDSEYPGVTATGTDQVRAVSDAFVLIDSNGQSSDGSAMRSATLVGYEPDADRFTGAVATSAVPTLFVYAGQLADDGQALILETEGPAMTPGRTTDRYRDIFRIVDNNHRYTAAEVFNDGKWKEFMRTEYTRVG